MHGCHTRGCGLCVQGNVQPWNQPANEGAGVRTASKPASLPSVSTYPASSAAGQVVTLFLHGYLLHFLVLFIKPVLHKVPEYGRLYSVGNLTASLNSPSVPSGTDRLFAAVYDKAQCGVPA